MNLFSKHRVDIGVGRRGGLAEGSNGGGWTVHKLVKIGFRTFFYGKHTNINKELRIKRPVTL
jgi:hypothetical protein